MNRELVGEPAVSAFLQSVRQNLDGHISGIYRVETSPIFFDPRKDLKKLKEKLTFVKDFLVDGEARRLGEESVDEWMDDLKDLLYDVDDILDDLKSLSNDQVRVDELFLNSNEIRERLIEIMSRSEVLGDKAKDLELKRGIGYALSGESKVTRRTPETSSMVDKSEIHGREDDKTDIVKRLLEVDGGKGKKNYDVLCIVGMGGLGKTTLAQLVYNDPEVVKHFDVKSWVCISNVFDVKAATKELIEYSDTGCSLGDQSLAVLQRRLKEMVANKRFLFVLDDVWSSSEWGEMKAPFSSCANGSKILVATRNIKIAHAFGNTDPYHLQGLIQEQSMELFRDKAFGDDDRDKAFRACGGVPLVVKVIGSMLQVADVEKWVAVSENTDHWVGKDVEIHPAIRFSYYNLPASLKLCFEYLAVFPPDYQLKQDDVVRMWIADGLVQDMEGRMAEDIGNEYYSDLKARSLIQENNIMHDIVHQLAVLMSRKFCYKENSKEPSASVRYAFLLNLNGMHYNLLAQAPGLRTLIVRECEDENILRNTVRSCKMLRTLHLSGNLKSLGALPEGIGNLKSLRALKLCHTSISCLPESICTLSQLQDLNINSCRNPTQLPVDIGNLKSLRALYLCWTPISSLPESICALSQLQDLNLEFCSDLEQLPVDIGNLKSLRTLNLNDTSISSLPESICALRQLQVLHLGPCRYLKQLQVDIGNLESLRSLYVSRTLISSLPESICALSQLQDLHLGSCHHLQQLPVDIRNLRSLRTLDLSWTSISRLPESFGALLQLQVLNLGFCEMLKEPPKDIGNLINLRRFYLTGHEQLTLHIGSLERDGRLRSGPNIIIGGVEEALMADLKSKNVRVLELRWSQAGDDEEMKMKIMEALEPHHALQRLTFCNYGRDKFPTWIMPSNICFSNLTYLRMIRLNKICEMVDMEFVTLESLQIEQCPILRIISIATPMLRNLYIEKCGELEAASVQLLPTLSDKAGTHSIVSQLEVLECASSLK